MLLEAAIPASLFRAMANGGIDVLAVYEAVARTFPSAEPHPHTFDFNRIDFKQLKAWAVSSGWDVSLAPEKASDTNFPPVLGGSAKTIPAHADLARRETQDDSV
jgi:hypothetical protein